MYILKRKGVFSGLALELKKEGEKIYNKKGELKTKHLKNQGEILNKLRAENWVTCFGIGFENAKRIIDTYLKADDKNPRIAFLGYECEKF